MFKDVSKPCVCLCVSVCVLVWAVCSPAQEQALLRFLPAVHTLSHVSALHIHCPQGAPGTPPSAPPPEGCIVGTVDHSCQLHLNVQVTTSLLPPPCIGRDLSRARSTLKGTCFT